MTKKYNITNTNVSKYNQLIETLNYFISNLTIQGIQNAYKSKKSFNKLMWIVLFLFSSILCSFFILKCITDYLNYEYITNINSYYERVITFPAVSFCSYNNPNFTFNIISVNFGYKEISDWKNHFMIYNDQNFGNCYRFNAGFNYSGHKIPIKMKSLVGIDHTLSINLFVNNSDFYGQYKVYIHNQSLAPITLLNYGFYITTGVFNYFSLRRVYEQKLEEPYNSCIKDPDLFKNNKTLIDFFKKINKTYNQQECLEFCGNMKYMEHRPCNCSIQSYDQNINAYCNKNNNIDCLWNFQEKLELNDDHNCSQYCPLECESFNYEINHYIQTIFSTGKIGEGFDYSGFNSYENVSKNFLSIIIYFEDSKYTLISQQPKFQIFDLISNIGGLFGLFLGMGLLSFVEIFEIILEIIIFFIKSLDLSRITSKSHF